MTSRDHARRLMLILLASEGTPLRLEHESIGAAGARAPEDDRATRAEPSTDGGETTLDAQARRQALIAAHTWT